MLKQKDELKALKDKGFPEAHLIQNGTAIEFKVKDPNGAYGNVAYPDTPYTRENPKYKELELKDIPLQGGALETEQLQPANQQKIGDLQNADPKTGYEHKTEPPHDTPKFNMGSVFRDARTGYQPVDQDDPSYDGPKDVYRGTVNVEGRTASTQFWFPATKDFEPGPGQRIPVMGRLSADLQLRTTQSVESYRFSRLPN